MTIALAMLLNFAGILLAYLAGTYAFAVRCNDAVFGAWLERIRRMIENRAPMADIAREQAAYDRAWADFRNAPRLPWSR